jgi:hypothetical protein
MMMQTVTEQHRKYYDILYSEAKEKGLSDRDADIVATKKIYRASTGPLADRYNISMAEVRKIFRNCR